MNATTIPADCEALAHWPRSSPWTSLLADQWDRPLWQELSAFLHIERAQHEVYPAADHVFHALQLTPPDQVRFVLLGQDPYHGPGQAHGLSFSVPRDMPLPPSLRNIFRELADDMGCPLPDNGDLSGWALQGGLLLNTVLTVRSGAAHSHRGQGWESFTDAIIQRTSRQCDRVAFVLWGRPARRKKSLIDQDRHLVIESPHPSPLSAHRGFFGSRPFSRINEFLASHDLPAIDWCSV